MTMFGSCATSGTPTAWAMGPELPRLAPPASTFTVKVNGVEIATFAGPVTRTNIVAGWKGTSCSCPEGRATWF